jgi:hypothetical protein
LCSPRSLTAPAKVDCATHFSQVSRLAISRQGAFLAAFATAAGTQAAWNARCHVRTIPKKSSGARVAEFVITPGQAQFAGKHEWQHQQQGFLTGYNAVKPPAASSACPVPSRIAAAARRNRAELGSDP